MLHTKAHVYYLVSYFCADADELMVSSYEDGFFKFELVLGFVLVGI